MQKNIKKYVIIGDVHGRTNWWDIVNPFNEETMYIFIGDYTDPYYSLEPVKFDQMIEQIDKMFEFKREHSENVIILIGNHDLQYIIKKSETNRYEWFSSRQSKIISRFKENKNLLDGVAYNIGDKYLISHAGVTIGWYEKYCTNNDVFTLVGPLSDVVEAINKIWKENKTAFTFLANAKMSDYYGTSPCQSPVWVRPMTLWEYNFFGFNSGKIQIVGHTAYDSEGYYPVSNNEYNRIATIGTVIDEEGTPKPVGNDNEHVDIIMTDCLRRETAYVEIDAETLEWKKVYLGDVESKIDWEHF